MQKLKKILCYFLISLVVISSGAIFSGCKQNENTYFELILESFSPSNVEIIKEDKYGNGAVKLKEERDVKVLQLTDIHIGNGILSYKKDKKAFTAVAKLIEDAVPDLIVVTGDIVYPNTLLTGSNDNLSAMKKFANFIEKYKTPWTICFGNHDSEWKAMYGKTVLCDFLESDELNYCLFNRGPEDVGLGNHVIDIYNADNSFNSSIFIFDNGEYDGSSQMSGYMPISTYQTLWYENEINKISTSVGKVITSFAYFHVPLTEYKTAWELYKEGSEEVKYYYGEANETGEKISTPNETGTFFEKAVSLNSTKAMFCGHNHLNDFSIEYKGIRLTFGKSIDYTAYFLQGITSKTAQRGSTTLIIKGLNSQMEKDFEIYSTKLVDLN